jgi:Ca2+-binding RTX toxin-like protein
MLWNRSQIYDAAWIRGTSGNDTLSGGNDAEAFDSGSGNDSISGSGGNDRLLGGSGNDTLSGGAGNDTFIFGSGFGQDIISDFTVGAASDDVIEFHDALFADFAAVMAAATSSGSNTILTVDAQTSITLQNVALANLHQDDFRFV